MSKGPNHFIRHFPDELWNDVDDSKRWVAGKAVREQQRYLQRAPSFSTHDGLSRACRPIWQSDCRDELRFSTAQRR